jgi:hypothetical protein
VSGKPPLRTLAVIAAVLFAIAAPALQAIGDLGLSASDFAGQGDSTLRAAGYAFSIWSLIYVLLVAYAVWQATPKVRENGLLMASAWPLAMAAAGCGLWIVVTSFDGRWLSILVILAAAAAAIVALMRSVGLRREASPFARRLTLTAAGLLAGWLTAASVLNIVTVATAEGLIAPAAQTPVALSALFAGAAVAAFVILRTSSIAYCAAVLWALVAIWVAERAHRPEAAWAALALGLALAAWTAFRAARTKAFA